jgi:hypothetical protein
MRLSTPLVNMRRMRSMERLGACRGRRGSVGHLLETDAPQSHTGSLRAITFEPLFPQSTMIGHLPACVLEPTFQRHVI